ncbi:hypothetical protein [Streptomyces sp. TS71-3]|uniref:hypothetical protein n=1 Tax=Streptomyces sp. TS71-3 TaxID=2733862 RepID=UPI001B0D8771|nr:hypothetical protein [Streptomyces sp. TS71-3]GHJ36391.1 hypothetical protein Sm713_20000 [Streptomyces sp. TS71-3]
MRNSPSAETSSHRHRRLFLARAVAVAATLTAMTGLSACSGNENAGDRPAPSSTPASRVCDGALDKLAAASLKRLGNDDRFKELTGETDAGRPNTFSLSRAAAHLHDKTELRSRCTLYLRGDTSGAPLIQLDFKAADSHPTRAAVEKAEPGRELTFYRLGAYAATSGDDSTTLYFACPTKGTEGTTSYVDASAFSSGNQLKGHSISKDRMTILNSVARHLAEKLGCADEARLPKTVPDGESVTP